MKTVQAYRFALDLTAGQGRDMLAHAGAARVAHNWALARVKAVMDRMHVVLPRLGRLKLQDLLGLRRGENQTRPARA